MKRDPRISGWAAQYIGPEEDDGQPEPVSVNEPGSKTWFRQQRQFAINRRNGHLQALRRRLFYCLGSGLAGVFIPPIGLLTWFLAVGWGIAAGLSLFEAVYAQIVANLKTD